MTTNYLKDDWGQKSNLIVDVLVMNSVRYRDVLSDIHSVDEAYCVSFSHGDLRESVPLLLQRLTKFS